MVEISKKNINEFLGIIGFKLKDGEKDTYYKSYTNKYELKIQLNNDIFSASTIDYGKDIKVYRGTTSNFSQQENFVVLECVNRLLEKGYPPENIELEKQWRVGGYLDIWVKDKNKKSFLMIECKTYDIEFDIEEKKTLSDGSQLFSYYQQEKYTKYLCLYSSHFGFDGITYKTDIIEIKDNVRKCENKESAFKTWDKIVQNKGLFEQETKPYLIDFDEIFELEEITPEISRKLYFKFATILRKHAISDKTNAYNKLFNLFLCKIVDEDKSKSKDYTFRFQWKRDDTFKVFLGRLSDLYKEGVEEYLKLEVTDYSEDLIENLLKQISKNEKYRDDLKRIYEELRLYKNNEFAFKEVYNEETFNQNALIVKEIVELFQNLQLRYNKRQQFLGDFFEKLLNTGIKQEQGQFFTPSPLTSFISKSLPIKELIEYKNNNKEPHILPYIMDYACGSGHFLTEIMSEIHTYLKDYDEKNIKGGRTAISIFNKLKEEYGFAEEYVYGIEKDYRLAKTSKVSTILNGDGLANVYCDDGLNSFNNYKESYKKIFSNKKSIDNLNFDIVVANPPYSVDNFKDNMIDFGKESFELYNYLGKNPNEIECLFIERTKHLLKSGGVAGIVLPDTILSNSSNLHSKTRELIFMNFDLIGIVKLGNKTFMDAKIKTIIIFLRKKESSYFDDIKDYVIKSINEKKDYAINEINAPINEYLDEIYEVNFKDFLTLLNYKPNENITNSDIYEEYKEEFFTHLGEMQKTKDYQTASNKDEFLTKQLINHILTIEIEKITYFIASHAKKVCIVKLPKETEEQELFLGYKISNSRGKEGLEPIKDSNYHIISSLYDETELLNKTKVNYYILNSFNQKYPNVDQKLNKIVTYEELNDLLDFQSIEFNKQIMLDNKIDWLEVWGNLNTKLNLEKLRLNCRIIKGTSITKKFTSHGKIPVIAGGKSIAYFHNISNRDGNIITLSASGKNAGYVWYHNSPIFASDCLTINSLNEKKMPTKYIYIILKYLQNYIFKLQKGMAQPHIYKTDLKKIPIPIIEENLTKKILNGVEELEKIEGKTEEYYNLKLKEIVELNLN